MNQRNWTIATLIEGFICLVVLLLPASESSSAVFFRYSSQRLMMIVTVVVVLAAIIFFHYLAQKKASITDWISMWGRKYLHTERNLITILLILFSGLLSCGYLIISWSTIDPLYQGIILRIAPILVWITLIGIQSAFFVIHWANEQNKEQGAELIPIDQTIQFLREIGLEIVAIIILIGAQYAFIPHRYWEYRKYLLRFSPALILGLVLISRLFHRATNSLRKYKYAKFAVTGIILASLVILGFYFYDAASEHSNTQNAELVSDQSGYVKLTEQVYSSHFRYTGNRNQMPLYLFLQALFFNPDNEKGDTFATGKQVNILLTMLLLTSLILIFRSSLPWHESLLLFLIASFSSFIFKAAYFTSENLYYFLSFLGFMLLCRMMIIPNIKLALSAGFILGLGHLTKASILPGILLFCLAFGVQHLFKLIQSRRSQPDQNSKYKQVQGFIFMLLLLATFGMTIFPYSRESHKLYGKYLYNVSYIVMWYDSWDEAVADADHSTGDPTWHHLTPGETPGPVKYFQEHTPTQIRDRILYGIERQLENIRYQFNLFNYPLFFALSVLIILITNLPQGKKLFTQHFFLIGFVLLYLAGYFSSFVWYSVIASLWRFIYGVHLPLMFILFACINAVSGKQGSHLTRLINISVSIMLIVDIYYVLRIGLLLNNFSS